MSRLSASSAQYYTPSGTAPPAGLARMMGLAVGAAVGLGVVYGALVQLNPFIYINILATGAFGFGIGWAAARGGHDGKVRSPLFAVLTGVLAGLVGSYVGWASWLSTLAARAGEGMLIWDPLSIAALIYGIGQEGAWSLKSFTPTGALLYGLWAIEALLIVGIAAWVARGDSSAPFCERCDAWPVGALGVVVGLAPDQARLKRDLEQGSFDALKTLEGGGPGHFTELRLSACPTCGDRGFLHLQEVTVTHDAKGNEKRKETVFVPNLQLNRAAMDELKSLFLG